MKGDNTTECLQFGVNKELLAVKKLKELGITLLRNEDEYGLDYTDDKNKKWEIKYDAWIGKTDNFLIELFASIDPSKFEKGWFYRYEEETPEYLLMLNDDFMFQFDYKELKEYIKKELFNNSQRDIPIRMGVKANPNGLIALVPFSKISKFIINKYKL